MAQVGLLGLGGLVGISMSGLGASAAANDLTAGDHEGQTKTAGVLGAYTDGNTSTYTELDSINFRFDLENDDDPGPDPASGRMEIRFTDGQVECNFFDGTFNLGTHDNSAPAVETISGATPTVTTIGVPTLDVDDNEWVQILEVAYADAGESRVNYYLTLTDEAGECNGASQHSRLENAAVDGGDFANLGANNQAVPANQIIELPEITVTKNIDRDGDGTFEDTADAGEFCFTLDPGACVPTDSNGQVLFTNVTPDGAHTITETQLDFTLGTYEFVSGSGEACVFNGSTATATVARGTTSDDASCIFNNAVVTADLTINKVTVGAASGSEFSVDIDCDVDSFDAANQIISQDDNIVVEDIPTGTSCTVTEDPDADFTTTYDPEPATVVIAEAGNSITITNTRRVGDLTINKVTIGAPSDSQFSVDIDCDVDSFDLSNAAISQTGAPGSIVISDIPTGTTCVVTEDPAAGFSTEIDGSPTLIIEAGNSITITNTFEDPEECPEEVEGLRGAFNRGGDDCPDEEDEEEAEEGDAEEDELDDEEDAELEDAGDPAEVDGQNQNQNPSSDQPVITPGTHVQDPAPAPAADPDLSPADEDAPIPLAELPRTGSSENLMREAMLALLLVAIGVPAMVFGRRRRNAHGS